MLHLNILKYFNGFCDAKNLMKPLNKSFCTHVFTLTYTIPSGIYSVGTHTTVCPVCVSSITLTCFNLLGAY